MHVVIITGRVIVRAMIHIMCILLLLFLRNASACVMCRWLLWRRYRFYSYVHVRVCVCVFLFVLVCTCVCICVYNGCAHARARARVYVCVWFIERKTTAIVAVWSAGGRGWWRVVCGGGNRQGHCRRGEKIISFPCTSTLYVCVCVCVFWRTYVCVNACVCVCVWTLMNRPPVTVYTLSRARGPVPPSTPTKFIIDPQTGAKDQNNNISNDGKNLRDNNIIPSVHHTYIRKIRNTRRMENT